MSYGRIGLDFLGGAQEGAAGGAGVSAALKAAGFSNPYAVPLIAGFAGAGALQRIMAGMADKPGEEMQMRLGNQQIAMNDLDLEAKRRQGGEERRALRKNRMLQDAVSSIFGRYQAMGKGGGA